MRDIEDNPYSPEETRVCEYLRDVAPDVGCGDDPIGFLIASHASLVTQIRPSRQTRASISDYIGYGLVTLVHVSIGFLLLNILSVAFIATGWAPAAMADPAANFQFLLRTAFLFAPIVYAVHLRTLIVGR